ncbi:hypothetical protein Fot_52887 [Forsythia ovata]|uniref:Transmembrane protein n=1 Tax=Forsythia ovata TaxID=205694 RepID=A0ABD1PH42_9LAMI
MLAQMNTSNGISLHFSSHTIFPSPPPQPPMAFPCPSTIPNAHHHKILIQSPFSPRIVCRSRRWDSNAESFRNFNFEYNSNYDDDENDGFDDEMEQWTEVLEDYVDSIWIIKVFRSFGWMLPFILIPLLLATGFKAFLMALALPVGQSTISFAFQRLRDRGKNKPKRKTKIKKRRSRLRTSRTVKLDEEWRGNQWTINKRTGYQSWVQRNDVSDKNSDRDAYSFGGWDDLDRREESNIGSSRRWGQRASRSPGMFTEKGKSSRRAIQSDLPLLLRLLVAVFPFLGSILTKML